MSLPVEQGRRSFEFDRDTFAFPHELVWRYRFDPVTGAMTVVRSDPPPAYYHRCFVMVRTVRQFFNHARFESGQPEIREESYRRLVREVVSRNPRQGCAEDEKVIIPGHEGLRAFSRKRETLLKAECGGPFVSYFLRSHWRMVFPISRSHQERMARQLKQSLHERGVSLVHLFRFPRITINHGIALFGAIESDADIQFDGYDPNIPEHPVKLVYERVSRTFFYPSNHYWGGGKLNVYEIYKGGLY